MANSAEISRVRMLASVADDDERFGDEYIEALIESSGGSVTLAASDIWRVKAAEYAELVDVSESGSTRKMSDLHKNALAMSVSLANVGDSAGGGGSTAGRPRTRRIVRPEPS